MTAGKPPIKTLEDMVERLATYDVTNGKGIADELRPVVRGLRGEIKALEERLDRWQKFYSDSESEADRLDFELERTRQVAVAMAKESEEYRARWRRAILWPVKWRKRKKSPMVGRAELSE